MYNNKFKIYIVLLLSILILTSCDNRTEIKKVNKKIDNTKVLYPWLEGDWQGELNLHAELKKIPAELKYDNGNLKIMFKEYCREPISFLSKNKITISIKCSNGRIQISPVDKNGKTSIKIKDIKIGEKFNLIYINGYNEKEKFAGWLERI